MFSRKAEGLAVTEEDTFLTIDKISKLTDLGFQVTSRFTWTEYCVAAGKKPDDSFLD